MDCAIEGRTHPQRYPWQPRPKSKELGPRTTRRAKPIMRINLSFATIVKGNTVILHITFLCASLENCFSRRKHDIPLASIFISNSHLACHMDHFVYHPYACLLLPSVLCNVRDSFIISSTLLHRDM